MHRRKRNHFVVKARTMALVLGDELRFEAAVKIARNVEIALSFRRQYRPLAAALVVGDGFERAAVLIEMARQLSVQHSVRKRFVELGTPHQ